MPKPKDKEDTYGIKTVNERMGNNISKLVRKFDFSVQEQRLIREAKYIDRKIWKPTSVKKEISLIIKQTVLHS